MNPPAPATAARRRVAAAADTLASLAIVAWVGGHAALGAFAARIVFRDLPRGLAAPTMNSIFRSFDGLILAALVVLAAATVARVAALGLPRRADRVALGAALGLLVVGALEIAYVHPSIEALFVAGRTLEPEFASLHKLSERSGHVEVVLAALWFGALAWPRAHALAAPLAALLMMGLAGCPAKRSPCAPSQPAKLELRDASGALELALKDSATEGTPRVYDLCDPAHHRIGSVETEEDRVVVLDGAGKLRLRVHHDHGLDPVAWGPGGERLRVHRDKNEWRVLKPDGVPFGSIAPSSDGATVFDPGGSALATVKARGADQVLAAPDGATTRYVIPAASPVAAGVFALRGLALDEALALFLLFPR